VGTLTDRVAAAKAAQREVTVEVRTRAEALAAVRALMAYLRLKNPCYDDELERAVRLLAVLAADGGEFVAKLETLIMIHDECLALMAKTDRTPADRERLDELFEAWQDCLLSLAHSWGRPKHDIERGLDTLGRWDVATAISDEVQ
jgi:hypothetical protein